MKAGEHRWRVLLEFETTWRVGLKGRIVRRLPWQVSPLIAAATRDEAAAKALAIYGQREPRLLSVEHYWLCDHR